MSPIKLQLESVMMKKCSICMDDKFCKLREQYKKIKEPDIKHLEHLQNCIFYKKFKQA